MKCPNCQTENESKNRFCSNCGYTLIINGDNDSTYIREMRQFVEDQREAKSLEKFDDLDLNNPTEVLKAQLRMLISIYRRMEKLENKEKQGLRVRVGDFDMPFWSLVGFEFKVFLVGLFFVMIFSCIGSLVFGSILGNFVQTLLQMLQ